MNRLKVNLVPPISNTEIEQMLQVLQPVVAVEVGRDKYGCEEYEFFDIDVTGVHRWGQSFITDAELGQQRYFPWRNGYGAVIPSHHTYGYHGFFKPSLAEALAAIRTRVPNWEEARYFWLKQHGDNRDILGNYHEARIYLFERDWGPK